MYAKVSANFWCSSAKSEKNNNSFFVKEIHLWFVFDEFIFVFLTFFLYVFSNCVLFVRVYIYSVLLGSLTEDLITFEAATEQQHHSNSTHTHNGRSQRPGLRCLHC